MQGIKIDILMATYDGEKYLREQLESLLYQSYKNWRLVIRDDKSSDNTTIILEEYKKDYPDKIEIVYDKKGNLGVKNNFWELMKYSKSNYIMFCDQDDIWLEEKIEKTLTKMKEIENGPTLIHTDLKVVGEKLNKISDSFWASQKLKPKYKTINRLAVQNNITGCTIMMNKELKELALKIDKTDDLIMHDWALGIIASTCGRIGCIADQTLLYRQHKNNVVGAKSKNIRSNMDKLMGYIRNQGTSKLLERQLITIINNLGINNLIMNEFCFLSQKKRIYRKYWLIKHNYLKQSFIRKVIQIILY